MTPKFTIVIPTRERSGTLHHALRTCVEQRYAPLDIIVTRSSRSTARRRSRGTKMQYCWPDHPQPEYAGVMTIPLASRLFICDARQFAVDCAELWTAYHQGPSLYNAFVFVPVIRAIQQKTGGVFFHSVIPDAYSSIAIASSLTSYLYSSRPFSVNSASGNRQWREYGSLSQRRYRRAQRHAHVRAGSRSADARPLRSARGDKPLLVLFESVDPCVRRGARAAESSSLVNWLMLRHSRFVRFAYGSVAQIADPLGARVVRSLRAFVRDYRAYGRMPAAEKLRGLDMTPALHERRATHDSGVDDRGRYLRTFRSTG